MSRPVVLRFLGDTSQLTRSFNATAAQATALSGQIGALNTKLGLASQQLIGAGATLSRRFTLPITYATGASAYLESAFEQAMTKIETLAGEGRGQVRAWSQDVRDLAKVMPVAPQDLAEALYFISSSGVDATRAMDLLKVSAKGSVVGLGSTKIVADALTSAMNAYGYSNLSAARAADILIGAVREGKGEAEDFAGSIGRVIAPAQLLGVSFDQVAAAMSGMTLVGLSADESATALRQIFFTLAKPSKQTAGALAEIGMSAEQVRTSIRERGLLTTLTDLRNKVGDNDQVLAEMFPNIRAFNGLTIMTGENVGNTARIFSQLAGESGALDAAYARTSENSSFKFELALNRLKLVGMSIGTEVLPRLVDSVTRFSTALLDGWNALGPAGQSLAVNIALVVAAVGPMTRVLGNVLALVNLIAAHPIIAAVLLIGGAFYLAYQRIEPFRNAVDAVARFLRDNLRDILLVIGGLVASTFLPAIAPIIALGLTLYGLYDRFAIVREIVHAVAGAIVDGLGAAIEWLKRFGPQAWDALQSAARAAAGVIGSVVRGMANTIATVRQAVQPLVDWFAKWFGPLISEAVGMVIDMVSGFGRLIIDTFEVLHQVGSPVLEFLIGSLQYLADVFGSLIGAAFEFAGPFLSVYVDGLKHAIDITGIFATFLVDVLSAAWTAVKPILGFISDNLIASFKFAFDAVKGMVEGFLQILTGVIQIIRGVFTGDWSKVWEGVKNVFGGIWHGIYTVVRSAIDNIGSYVAGLPGRILEVLAGLGSAGLQLGSAFITGLVNGIKGIAGAAIDIASGFTEAMLTSLKTGWNKIVDWLNRQTNGIEIDMPIGPTIGLPDNLWNVLKFANGGIVSGPTFAMIGEAGAEAVVPLTRPARAAAVMREAGLLPMQGSAPARSAPSLVVNQQIYALDPYEAARRADVDWQWAMKTMSGR